ncbi:hypothetical protein [Flagellimonas sp.]|uniref:hypothetical protein n=1 Tax=Flagellimonas sp. TaxID=2058762 RepID=UPI003B5CF8B4
MKKLLFAISAVFIIGLYSCETEPVGEQALENIEGKGKKNQKNSSVQFDLSEDCTMNESTLFAGQHTEVGKVSVTESGGNYIVTYEITNSEWCITETHLSVVNTPEDFPMNNGGNPKIGNFEYKGDHECEKTVTYEVPIEKGPYIAAHAVVECVSSSVENIVANLPDVIDFCTTAFRPNNGDDGYFSLTIEDGFLSGDYGAWCVDVDQRLRIECIEAASVHSSLGDLPDEAFEMPENFGAVNWLLNQNIIGQPSENGSLYTGDDLQMVIWLLIDDLTDLDALAQGGALSNWDEDRVNELMAASMENGSFQPECGDYIGIILVPEGKQPVIIPYPLECSECEETAWADGCDFPGGSWATYFTVGN